MKTFLILIVLVILTIIASYGQDTKNCYGKKTVHKKMLTHKAHGYAVDKTTPPKFTNRIHNVTSEEIPGAYPGNDVWIYEYSVKLEEPGEGMPGYQSENTYTGKYPAPALQDTRVSPREVSNTRPPNDDLCLWKCR